MGREREMEREKKRESERECERVRTGYKTPEHVVLCLIIFCPL